MKVCGIIVEYNPLHNGHLHHINKTKEITGCDVLIACMSPNFTQRGEPAIINKFIRTQYALESGIDIIIELPSVAAIQSAEHFAKIAIDLLNQAQVDIIVFGSECDDINNLINLAKISITPAYQALVKEYLANGQRYATACNLAFNAIGLQQITSPNDILGLNYLKAIYKNNYNIIPYTIKRTNEFHSLDITKIASATAIRQALAHKNSISDTTPLDDLLCNSDELVYIDDFFTLLQYQLYTKEASYINNIHGFEEGLEYRFLKYIKLSNNMNDFINQVSTKRYPKTRIQRAIVALLVNLSKEDVKTYKYNYLRILGMSLIGQKHLKKIKDTTNFSILTKLSDVQSSELWIEQKFTALYSLAKPQLNYLVKKEYQQPVIIRK